MASDPLIIKAASHVFSSRTLAIGLAAVTKLTARHALAVIETCIRFDTFFSATL